MDAKDRIVQFLANGPKRTEWLNDKIGDGLDYVLGPTGIPDRLNAIGLLNPVQDIYEAGGNARDGDYAGAAINTASALMPVVGAKLAGGGLADDAANIISDTLTNVGTRAQGAMDAGQAFAADEFGGVGPSKGIRAYHGSPHDFDRFSMDAIGTGEGAQAYGHGLYFAENEGVARGYRDALSPSRRLENQRQIEMQRLRQSIGFDEKDLASIDQGNPQGFLRIDAKSMQQDIARNKARLAELEAMQIEPDGRMYEVNINANPDDFLDWDAPLSEQPGVLERLGVRADSSRLREVAREMYGTDDPWAVQAAMKKGDLDAAEHQAVGRMVGSEGYYQRVGDISRVATNPEQIAAQELREAGIPGIKYKDAGSRGADGGTRNFVVFDENLIEIVRKYGIAGAAAMLGVSAGEVQAAMQQNNRDLANEITSRGVQ